MAIVKVTESNFEQEVLQAEGKVGKVNVDEEPALAAKFGVMSIPTLLVFENGKVVKQSIGYIEKDEVMALIQ